MRTSFLLAALLALPASAQGAKPQPPHATINNHPHGKTPPPAPKRPTPPAKHRDSTTHVRGAAPVKSR